MNTLRINPISGASVREAAALYWKAFLKSKEQTITAPIDHEASRNRILSDLKVAVNQLHLPAITQNAMELIANGDLPPESTNELVVSLILLVNSVKTKDTQGVDFYKYRLRDLQILTNDDIDGLIQQTRKFPDDTLSGELNARSLVPYITTLAKTYINRVTEGIIGAANSGNFYAALLAAPFIRKGIGPEIQETYDANAYNRRWYKTQEDPYEQAAVLMQQQAAAQEPTSSSVVANQPPVENVTDSLSFII